MAITWLPNLDFQIDGVPLSVAQVGPEITFIGLTPELANLAAEAEFGFVDSPEFQASLGFPSMVFDTAFPRSPFDDFLASPDLGGATAQPQSQLFVNDQGFITDPTGTPLPGNVSIDNLESAITSALREVQTAQTAGQTPDPGILDRLNTATKPISDFLSGSLGRTLGILGLGGLGLLLGQVFAGDAPKFELPQPSQPPAAISASRNALNTALTSPRSIVPAGFTGGTTVPIGVDLTALGPSTTAAEDLDRLFRFGVAGQRNLADLGLAGSARELVTQAEQSPIERAVRQRALEETPGLLNPPANLAPTLATGLRASDLIADTIAGRPQAGQTIVPGMLSDPVRAELEQYLLRSLRGELPSPEFDRQFREEEEQLRNTLFQQVGSGYEMSTPGIDALRKLRESQDLRRAELGRQTIAAFAPQEFSRRQFATTFPESRFQSRFSTFAPAELSRAQFGENVRQQGLSERTSLATNFGRVSPATLTTSLGSLVPISPLLGLGDEARERSIFDTIRTQSALNAFNLGNQERSDRARSIAGLFGTAAGVGLGGLRF